MEPRLQGVTEEPHGRQESTVNNMAPRFHWDLAEPHGSESSQTGPRDTCETKPKQRGFALFSVRGAWGYLPPTVHTGTQQVTMYG